MVVLLKLELGLRTSYMATLCPSVCLLCHGDREGEGEHLFIIITRASESEMKMVMSGGGDDVSIAVASFVFPLSDSVWTASQVLNVLNPRNLSRDDGTRMRVRQQRRRVLERGTCPRRPRARGGQHEHADTLSIWLRGP